MSSEQHQRIMQSFRCRCPALHCSVYENKFPRIGSLPDICTPLGEETEVARDLYLLLKGNFYSKKRTLLIKTVGRTSGNFRLWLLQLHFLKLSCVLHRETKFKEARTLFEASKTWSFKIHFQSAVVHLIKTTQKGGNAADSVCVCFKFFFSYLFMFCTPFKSLAKPHI